MHITRRIAFAVLIAGALAACSSDGGTATTGRPDPSGNGGSEVAIADFVFEPSTLTVTVGTEVTWTNEHTLAHTATADDESFDSGSLGQGESFSRTFDTPGTFAYHCTIHPSMTATVIVEG
jgi:plastocyanin